MVKVFIFSDEDGQNTPLNEVRVANKVTNPSTPRRPSPVPPYPLKPMHPVAIGGAPKIGFVVDEDRGIWIIQCQTKQLQYSF